MKSALGSEMSSDRPGNVGRVAQEGAEVKDGAQLHGEPEAVVLPAPDVDELAGSDVEVKY